MLKAMTTIEFCEKYMKNSTYNASSYDRGPFGNMQAVLGDSPLLWLLPLSPPSGKGLHFLGELEPGRGLGRLRRGVLYGTSKRHSGKCRRTVRSAPPLDA